MIILGFITNSGKNSPVGKLPQGWDWALHLPGAVGWAGINPGLFVAHRPAALTAGFSSAPSFIKPE